MESNYRKLQFTIASALLQGSLALFPARYRREYREERSCVLQLALEEAAAAGWLQLLLFLARELRDLPLSLLREYSKEWRVPVEANELREPWYTPWAGIFPFVLLGLMALSFEIPLEWGPPERFYVLAGILMFGGYLAILVGLLAGALAGFPRWSFPYMIYAFVFALYISNASTPGLIVFNIELWGREMWGWRAYVPLGFVILLVAIFNRHPGKLLDRLWHGVVQEWPRLTFGFYGLLPFVLFVSFDEVDHLYGFPALLAGELLIVIGAFFYLHLKTPNWRTFSLFAFAFLAIFVTQVATHFYWETHSINILTNERFPKEGPIPYTSILTNATKGAFATMLFLALPGLVKLLGYLPKLGKHLFPSG